MVYISIFLFLVEIITLYNIPPANGYELSIYEQYPLYFWMIFVILYSIGASFFLFFSDNSDKNNRSLLIGIVIMIITNGLFLLIPAYRYYPIWGHGDIHTHLGSIRDILSQKTIGFKNFYPIIHITSAIFISLLGIPLIYISNFINVLFTSIFLINMLLVSYSFSKHYKKSFYIMLCFSSPLIYGAYHKSLHPSMISTFMIPLVIYLIQERTLSSSYKFERTILTIISSLFIIFCHPVTTIILVIFLLTINYSHKIRYIINKRPTDFKFNTIYLNIMIIILFYSWYFNFASIHHNITTIFSWFYERSRETLISETLNPLARSNINVSQMVSLFINRYGSRFVLLVIPTIICFVILYNEFFKNKSTDSIKFTYTLCYLISLLFAGTQFFGYFIEREINRAIRLSLIISPILIALAYSDFMKENNNDKMKKNKNIVYKIFIMIILIFISSLNYLNLYGSPRTYASNNQVTLMEIEGAKWYEEYKDPYAKVLSNTPYDILRFRDLVYGNEFYVLNISRYKPSRLPSHFGYGENGYVLETYISDRIYEEFYIILTDSDKLAYMVFPDNVKPLVHQYNNSDILKLNMDKNIYKIYSNSDFDMWKISLPDSHPHFNNTG